MKSSLSSLVNDRKWAQRLCNMRNFFFLKISILCSRQERAYLIFCGTGTHVYGCINMVHVGMNLWLVTYLWSAHLFSFWCNSLFCAFCFAFSKLQQEIIFILSYSMYIHMHFHFFYSAFTLYSLYTNTYILYIWCTEMILILKTVL